MKLLFWIVGVVAVLTVINYKSSEHMTEPSRNVELPKIEDLNPLINVQKTVIKESNKIQLNIEKQQEINRINAFNAQKVKIYVRAKDTKTCMKVLKIDIINNEVAECNRDHYVEVKNDELDKFKKEQGL